MIADLSFSLQCAASCSFSAKESNTLQLKKKQQTKKPDTESANEHGILRATPPAPPQPQGRVLGLSLWRIQSLPGNRTLWRTISAMMHPTDQMSTTKYQVIKKQPESLASPFLNHLPDTSSPSKHSLGGSSANSWYHIWMTIFKLPHQKGGSLLVRAGLRGRPCLSTALW